MPTAAPPNPEIRNRDLLALRSYVTAKDATQYKDAHHSTVVLDLTHSNLVQRHIEIRFDKHDSLSILRNRIHQKTGTAPHFQHLQIKSGGQILQEIPPETEEHFKLGYFGLEHHGMEVHCVDLNPQSASLGGQYEDTSLVDKYVMSEEEYNARKGTLRDWEREQKAKDSTFTLAKHAKQHRELVEAQRQHKLGLPLPEGFFVDSAGTVVRDDSNDNVAVAPNVGTKDMEEEMDPQYALESVEGIEVGHRCQVEPGARRGEVKYVGEVPELGPGWWVGIAFDEPVGKTDGTAKEKRYFETLPKQAGFVRGKNVQVGDFPERDLFDSDDSDDEL